MRLWSKKRGDYKLETQWSSCQLELFGILNCVVFFHWEIDFVSKPVTVITDSLSVKKLFDRARQGKELCPDKKINDQIVKLLAFDIEIVYEKGESTQIDLADFISRTEYLQKACTDNCRICSDKKSPVSPEYGKLIQFVSSSKRCLPRSTRKCSGGSLATSSTARS